MTIYLSIDQIVQINVEMVDAFGGTAGYVIAARWRRPLHARKMGITETLLKPGRLCAKVFSKTIRLSMGTNELLSRRQRCSTRSTVTCFDFEIANYTNGSLTCTTRAR